MCAATLYSQELDSNRLDAFFEHIRLSDQGSGSLSIFQNGEEVYQHSTGFSDIENGTRQANGKWTKYRIGSVSKTYTAVIILQMIQEGKLTLDSPLSTFYPPFPKGDEVTIKQLLNHHSGLHNITEDEEYGRGMYREWQRVELLDHFAAKGYDFEPDSVYDYSNTNYMLLSMIAEIIDGKFFAGIVSDRICKPLGLISTYYGNELSPANQEARSFKHWGNWLAVDNTHHSIPLGAGGIVTTATEMNIFMEGLFSGKLIDDSHLEMMIKPRGKMGLGIINRNFVGRKTYGHNGAIDGYRAIISHVPSENLTVAYASNAERLDIDEIFNVVMRIVLNEEYTFPSFPAFEYENGELDKFKGRYINKKAKNYIDVRTENDALFVQMKGQMFIPIDNLALNEFVNSSVGFKVYFNKSRTKMKLLQNGRKSVWKRQRKI